MSGKLDAANSSRFSAARRPLPTLAQTYPTRPVRIIAPFAPAGPTDVFARLLVQKLSQNLGQQFYIENQVGAGGNIGMGNAARAAPYGYTIVFLSTSYIVNPSLYAKIPYDPFKDFAPVTLAAISPNVLTVYPSIPARTVKELIAEIKANPSKYSFASAGLGTTPHLSGELFKLSQGLDLVRVPFRSRSDSDGRLFQALSWPSNGHLTMGRPSKRSCKLHLGQHVS